MIESVPKPEVEVEKIADSSSDEQKIIQLEKIIEETKQRITKYEEKIGPNLILMIKNTVDKLNSANEEIRNKDNQLIQLNKQVALLKEIILKLKAIWSV